MIKKSYYEHAKSSKLKIVLLCVSSMLLFTITLVKFEILFI